MASSLEIVLPPNYPSLVEPKRRPDTLLTWLFGRVEPAALGRLSAVDLVRGFVCLSIVLGHNGLHPSLWTVPAFGSTFVTWNAFRPGTECFMVLSGFFLGHMLRPRAAPTFSVGRFLWGRLVRLAVPFWVALTLVYCYALFAAHVLPLHRPPPTVAAAVADFLFVSDLAGTPRASHTFWSLAVLLQAYFLWTALFWLVRWGFLRVRTPNAHRRAVGVLNVLAAAAFGVGLAVLAWGDRIDTSRWMLLGNLAYLAAGWLTYQTATGTAGRWVLPACAAGLVTAAVAQSAVRPVYAAAVAAVLLGVVGLGTFRVPGGLRWLAVVGGWSFSIYLTHGLIGHKLFGLALSEGRPIGVAGAAGLSALTVAACVLLGAAFHWLVEKPTARWAREGAAG